MIKKDFDDTVGGYFSNNNLDRDDITTRTNFGLYKVFYKGELIHNSAFKVTKSNFFMWRNPIIIGRIEEINKKFTNN